MLVCATVGTSSPSVGIEVRFRAPALHVEYIDWHVSCASFSNPNRMNTLHFSTYDYITYSNTSYNCCDSRFARLVSHFVVSSVLIIILLV